MLTHWLTELCWTGWTFWKQCRNAVLAHGFLFYCPFSFEVVGGTILMDNRWDNIDLDIFVMNEKNLFMEQNKAYFFISSCCYSTQGSYKLWFSTRASDDVWFVSKFFDLYQSLTFDLTSPLSESAKTILFVVRLCLGIISHRDFIFSFDLHHWHVFTSQAPSCQFVLPRFLKIEDVASFILSRYFT